MRTTATEVEPGMSDVEPGMSDGVAQFRQELAGLRQKEEHVLKILQAIAALSVTKANAKEQCQMVATAVQAFNNERRLFPLSVQNEHLIKTIEHQQGSRFQQSLTREIATINSKFQPFGYSIKDTKKGMVVVDAFEVEMSRLRLKSGALALLSFCFCAASFVITPMIIPAVVLLVASIIIDVQRLIKRRLHTLDLRHEQWQQASVFEKSVAFFGATPARFAKSVSTAEARAPEDHTTVGEAGEDCDEGMRGEGEPFGASSW